MMTNVMEKGRNVTTLKTELREGLSEVTFDQKPKERREGTRRRTRERSVGEENSKSKNSGAGVCSVYL